MASLDKASVREEVARLKADFEKPSSQGKVSPETGALFKSLLLIVEPNLVHLPGETKPQDQQELQPAFLSNRQGQDQSIPWRGCLQA